jgi:hypothetical protein
LIDINVDGKLNVFPLFFRQLGHKSGSLSSLAASPTPSTATALTSPSPTNVSSKLVPLVQGLSHQVHLFLVEYNKYNNLKLNLPGYRPKNGGKWLESESPPESSPSEAVPEDILHQQRLLLQNCDRLKLCVSRHQGSNRNMSDVVEVITRLGTNFTKLVELMLSKEIKVSEKYNLRRVLI